MTTILTDAEKSALQFLEEFGGWMIYYENQKSDIASNVNATIPSLQTFKSLQNLNIVENKRI
ncbi:MAG: hypothetical protein HC817_11910 [Saprospiraceae bacterium]|nr:hypothetical protein [Saprospiraceae bacterium]